MTVASWLFGVIPQLANKTRTLHGWPLVLAAQQQRMGGGMMPDRPQHQTEPDWLMRAVEEYWVGPCSAKLPEIMHGTPCM